MYFLGLLSEVDEMWEGKQKFNLHLEYKGDTVCVCVFGGVREGESYRYGGQAKKKDKVYSLFFNIVFFYLAPFRGGVVGRVLFVIPE